jgi:hypothetical protein
MKIQKNIKWVAAFAAVCLAAHTALGAVNSIGVNIVTDNNPGGDAEQYVAPGGFQGTTNVDYIYPAESAGVYPQANWNNVGRFGDTLTMVGSNGASSGVVMSWNSYGTWHSFGYAGYPLTLDLPDARLMDGYVQSTWVHIGQMEPILPGTDIINNLSAIEHDQPIVLLSGLSQLISAAGGGSYSIIWYMNGNQGGDVNDVRNGAYWIDAASGPSTDITDNGTISPTLYVQDTTQFNGSNYVAASPTATNLASVGFANYVQFDGLTNDEILLRLQNVSSSPATAVNGIQILAQGLNIPPHASTPTFAPVGPPGNTVYAGTQVTALESATGKVPLHYQWQADNHDGNLVTIPDATNTTLAINAVELGVQYTNEYVCIVTNDIGVATSGVAYLYVNVGAAPILTTDISRFNTNIYAYAGGSVTFNAAFTTGTLPITNNWLVSLDSGGGFVPVPGATGSYYTLVGVQQPASDGWYELAATNIIGSSYSSGAHVTSMAALPAPNPSITNVWTDGYDNFVNIANSYANYVVTNNPWAYWQFKETADTYSRLMQAYDYSGHGFDATYGNSNGVAASGCRDGGEAAANTHHGPGYIDNVNLNPDGYWGFESNSVCMEPSYSQANGAVWVPSLNLTTNTVTFTMWIKPRNLGAALAGQGLFMYRNGSDAAGVALGQVGTTNTSQMPCLIYNWNRNNPSTYGWNSGLYPVLNQWQFVACVVSPANTTMYLYYCTAPTTGSSNLVMQKSANYVTNALETFNGGTTWIGSDNYNNNLTFNGDIAQVAVFTNALNENQIQGMFLRAIGMTTGVAPSISSNPPSMTVYRGQPLMMSVGAVGIPSPTSFQWQAATNVSGPNGNAVGTLYIPVDGSGGTSRYLTGSLTSTITFSNYNSSYTWLRSIAMNTYGNATSSWASITKLLAPTNGVWTINFAVTTANNNGTNTPFAAYGLLGYKTQSIGGGTYWNALSGSSFTNATPSKLDDGVTVSTINLSNTNSFVGSWYNAGSSILLDQYINFGTNGTAMRFTGVPSGVYNLALYGTDAGPRPNYADRGTIFTVLGVSQSVTNSQDAQILPDNTTVFMNLVVTNGTLEVDMIPGWCPKYNSTNSEGDFNAAQLQLVKYAPGFTMVGKINTNTLTWVSGGLWSATNINGPWTTNPGVSPFTFNPTGYQKYFRVYNPTWPN